jgi:hypothetical protein
MITHLICYVGLLTEINEVIMKCFIPQIPRVALTFYMSVFSALVHEGIPIMSTGNIY